MTLALRYKPRDTSEYVWSDGTMLKIYDRFKSSGCIDNTLLYGDTGVGKTAFFDALFYELKVCESYGNLHRFKTNSAGSGNDEVAELQRITAHYLGIGGGHSKCVIFIDELDQLKDNTFKWLKMHMEPLSRLFVFCGATNHLNKIPPAVAGRFNITHELRHATADLILARVKTILQREAVPLPADADLRGIIARKRHCVREILNAVDLRYC
jgi:replication-associated recombination protein RarA